jgi:hypothetical protein
MAYAQTRPSSIRTVTPPVLSFNTFSRACRQAPIPVFIPRMPRPRANAFCDVCLGHHGKQLSDLLLERRLSYRRLSCACILDMGRGG